MFNLNHCSVAQLRVRLQGSSSTTFARVLRNAQDHPRRRISSPHFGRNDSSCVLFLFGKKSDSNYTVIFKFMGLTSIFSSPIFCFWPFFGICATPGLSILEQLTFLGFDLRPAEWGSAARGILVAELFFWFQSN